MTDTSAQPAQKPGQQNQPSQNGEPALSQDLQQRLVQALQPSLAALQQQMTQAIEQQFAPLRSQMLQLAQSQQAAPTRVARRLEESVRPARAGKRQDASPNREATSQETAPAEGRQEEHTPEEHDGAESFREVASSEDQGEASALQQWGENLEAAALMVLALGEVLEGVALLLQAIAYLQARSSAGEHRQAGQASLPEEGEHEEEGGGPSALKKLSEVASSGASSLKHLFSRDQEGEAPSDEEQEDGEESEEKDEGGPSFFSRVSDAASHSVSSLKEALSTVTGDGGSSRDRADILKQWGTILDHASSLLLALGDLSSSKQRGKSGLASLGKWWKIYGHARSLVDELKLTFGDGSASRHRQGDLGLVSKVENVVGGVLSSDGDKDGESSQSEQGGVSSALKALTGGSSSKKSEGEGGGLLDALTGEDSPLQTLREFSKRQQGPGGLAPKGPMGRKPPPGPLRRDRLADTKSGGR